MRFTLRSGSNNEVKRTLPGQHARNVVAVQNWRGQAYLVHSACFANPVVSVELARVLELRRTVLGWPDDAFDGDHIAKTVHLGVLQRGRVIGAVSYMPSPCPDRAETGGCYFWAMAVAADHQRHGHGRSLIDDVRTRARRIGATVLWADARESALPFYRACGGITTGRPYVDDVTGLIDYRVILPVDRRIA